MIIQNQTMMQQITYNTKTLKSNLGDYGDAYILVRGHITVVAAPVTQVTFENCALLTKCITKIDEMPMYNLIEHSSNYSETAEGLWFDS